MTFDRMSDELLSAEIGWLLTEADSLEREVALEHGGDATAELDRIAGIRGELANRGWCVDS